MESFAFTLINDRLRSYQLLATGVIVLHFFIFNYLLLRGVLNAGLLAGLCITLLALLTRIFKKGGYQQLGLPVWAIYIALAVCWAMSGQYWMLPVLLLLAWLDQLAGRKIRLVFYPDRIVLRAFPKKTIRWETLSNVILKDGILTLNYTNDHILQSAIAPESQGISENEFNSFCTSRLANKD